MFTSTLRSMVAHKLRLVLTTASIALGVAFLAGTLVLTDTMGLAFDQLFGKVSSGTDAVVRTEAPYTESDGVGTSRGPDRRRRPRRRPARRRRPRRRGLGHRLRAAHRQRRQGHHHQGRRPHARATACPRTRGSAATSSCSPAPRRTARTRSPSTPPAPRSTTSRSARRSRCCSRARPRSSPWSAPSASVARRTSAAPRRRTSTPRPRSRCSARPGFFDTIGVSAEDGVSQAELAERLNAVVPEGHRGRHRRTRSPRRTPTPIKEDLKIVGILFMIFAGIALFVGAFIIWNTFTMIVTQRSREIALLRAIGATRRQVMRSLLARGGRCSASPPRRSGSASASPWPRD